ncbi:hypothetical protein [Thermoclostridium stercorarium]|nr:hypothetical protein [Thermoclostridium stercorarium]
MDLGTVMLMLAVGSFLFGLLLSIFKFNNNRPEEIPYWIAAKILQAVGSLLLYYEADSVALLTILADILILAGCAYEIWAVRILMGHSVKPGSHISTAVAIILASLVSIFMEYPFRNGYIFLLQSILYFLPGLFLLGKSYG